MRECDELPKEQQAALATIADSILENVTEDWAQHFHAPGEMSKSFLQLHLSSHGMVPEAEKVQVRRCLFRLLAEADLRILEADHEKLRAIYHEIRADDGFWIGGPDYLEKLLEQVRGRFTGVRHLSTLRAHHLAIELNYMLLGRRGVIEGTI